MKMIHRHFLFMLLLPGLTFSSFAAANQKPGADTLQVIKILEKGLKLADENQPDSAEFYYLKAHELSRQLGYRRGTAQSLRYYLKVLNHWGRYKQGLVISLQAVEASKGLSAEELSIAYNNAGRMSWLVGQLEAAASLYVEALQIAKATNHQHHQMWFCNNLASVFRDLQDEEKCYEYAQQSYLLARQLDDSAGMSSSLANIGYTEILHKQYKSAEKHLQESLKLARLINRMDFVLAAYVNLGQAEMEQENYPNALGYYQQGLQIIKSYPSPINELYLYAGLTKTYYQLELFAEAGHYLLEGIKLGKTINNAAELRNLYHLGAHIAEKRHQLSDALDYRKKYEALNDSLFNLATKQSIHRMEIEYQTSQKEKEIAQQNLLIARNSLELERKNNLIYLYAAVLIALLSGLLIFYILYINRQKANRERIRALERENELKVLMASIAGEEKERSRLARELHDGVGGILSATKMHLSVLRNENALAPLLPKFEQASQLLDSASREVRSIAHNLSPDTLLKYRLEEALEKFCRSVSNDLLQVDFYALGEPFRLKANIRFIIYRVVQELVNNIIKHAQASRALVQLSHHEQILSLTVEDNGQGFNLQQDHGIGLTNLQNRIQELNGQLHLESVPGQGTTVYLELDTTPYLEKEEVPFSALNQ